MQPPVYSHLVLVCCHAIYLGGPANGDSESEWLIEPFQKGETPTFTAHVRAGIKALTEDPTSILVLSGGATKKPKTDLTEAESYYTLARDNHLFAPIDSPRILVESHATDSYQNLLFSILSFRLHVGVYPERVTVVTHEFKRERFLECHFPAVGLGSAAALVGINPPEDVTSVESLVDGEMRSGIGLWRRDLYGVGPDLAGKRARRGWIAGMENGVFVNVGLERVVEELVTWDGGQGNEWFSKMDQLPWYNLTR